MVLETNEAKRKNIVLNRSVDVNTHPTNDRIEKTIVGGLNGLKQVIVLYTDFTLPNPVEVVPKEIV